METLPSIPLTSNKKLNKAFRNLQPFWNNELDGLWFSVCQAERNYSNSRVLGEGDIHLKRRLHQIYKDTQKLFDKKLRYFKRKYKNKDLEELDKLGKEGGKSADIWKS